MVFLARTTSPSEWKAVANSISTLVEEASFEATSEGLSFRAMDPSHVALVDLNWPSSAFEKYECDSQLKFTVRVEDFVKLIKRADTRDSVEISRANEETLVLRIQDGYKREYKLHLIESTSAPTPLPKLAFNSKLMMTEATFEKILSDISVVSDHTSIDTTKDRVVFSGKSDAGSASAEMDKSGADLLELDVKEDSKATYSIDYLLNITKAAGATSDTVICEYSSKMPVRLEFRLSEMGGTLWFYLAPRVEER